MLSRERGGTLASPQGATGTGPAVFCTVLVDFDGRSGEPAQSEQQPEGNPSDPELFGDDFLGGVGCF